jgi:hypothetical protein
MPDPTDHLLRERNSTMPHRNHHQEGASEKGKTPGNTGDSLMTRARDVVSNAGQAASDTLTSAGQKADEMAASAGNGFTGMIEDCGEFVRRHPVATMLMCFGFGFLMSQALRGR